MQPHQFADDAAETAEARSLLAGGQDIFVAAGFAEHQAIGMKSGARTRTNGSVRLRHYRILPLFRAAIPAANKAAAAPLTVSVPPSANSWIAA